MNALERLSAAIDRLTALVGRIASWGIVAAIVVSAGNAVSRKLWSSSSNALLEVQWYLFGFTFMLCAAWALARNEHARIDVISVRLSRRMRAWIELFGHLFFLAPFAILMTWLSVPYFLRSFHSMERSANAGGLVIWPAKFLVLAGFALLLVQLVSQIIKTVLVLAGARPPTDAPDQDREGVAP